MPEDDYKIRENIGILQCGHEYQKFVKDSGKHIEGKKLKVILISPSSSPVLLLVNGDMKQDISNGIHVQKDRVPSGVENIPPPLRVSEEVKGLEMAHDMEEDRTDEDIVTRHAENAGDMKPAKDAVQLNLTKDSEELNSRLSMMDSKLREAEVTIMKLNEERHMNTWEKDLLKSCYAIFINLKICMHSVFHIQLIGTR